MITVLAIALSLHTLLLLGVSAWASTRVDTADDYLVAGRRLGLLLSTGTLVATWFGAGTVLTASEEVRHDGLQKAVLDPLGAGLCLLLAGVFLAAPLRRMNIDTLGDFFRERFGPRVELVASLLMSPSYFGWIAAQFVALGEVLHTLLGLPVWVGILVVASVGLITSLTGGMWSVTLTDTLQMGIVGAGLLALLVGALGAIMGESAQGGLDALFSQLPPAHAHFIPDDGLPAVLAFTGVLAAGALGNLPGQDLFQRVFAAKDERTAVRACLLSGGLYLTLGAVPVLIGLAARVLLDDDEPGNGLVRLGLTTLPGPAFVLLVLALYSAVISTVNSAILSPAALLSRNVFDRVWPGRLSPVTSLRTFTVLVTLVSLALAFVGESAYALLEGAYELPLAALLVPFLIGARGPRMPEASAIAAMLTGAPLFLLHLLAGWESFFAPWIAAPLPTGLCCAALSLVVMVVFPRRARPPTPV